MPITPKRIKGFTNLEFNISDNEFDVLKKLAQAHSQNIWGQSNASLKISDEELHLIAKFKASIKDYLFAIAQGRYCCYCGYTLEMHKATYDLEHIICKDGKRNIIFHINNLALSCKSCNTSKSTKKITIPGLDENEDLVFELSEDYIIVHPHFDDWDNHLLIDKYDRVLPKENSEKGELTIKTCGISKKNAMSLADHFDVLRQSPEFYKNWIDFYIIFKSEEESLKRRNYKKFLLNLLSMESDPAGKELIDLLELN